MAAANTVRDARDAEGRVVCLRLPSRPEDLVPAGASRQWLVVEAPTHCYVPKVLERKGLAGYEPEAVACFLAVTAVARPGAVWDVGANAGVYGLVARALSQRAVRGFEPTPDLADLAESIAVANGLPYPVERIALGAQAGTATLYLSDVTDSSNSLAAGFRPSSRTLVVPLETVDDVVRRTGETPAVLKIDTETTEPDVLRGAEHLIRAQRPWILCEVLANRSEEALMDVLRPWQYRWFPISDEPPFREAETIHGDPTYHNLMWLFAPEHPGQRFWDLVDAWRKQLNFCEPVMTGVANARFEPRRTRRVAMQARREFATSRNWLSRLEASITAGGERMAAKLDRYPLRGARARLSWAYRLWHKQLRTRRHQDQF
jgi:FkbM family methyltransferase